jgi:hypothetical protein
VGAGKDIGAEIAAARAEARAIRQQLGTASAWERAALLAALAALAARLEELHRAQDRARCLAAVARLRGHRQRAAPGEPERPGTAT